VTPYRTAAERVEDVVEKTKREPLSKWAKCHAIAYAALALGVLLYVVTGGSFTAKNLFDMGAAIIGVQACVAIFAVLIKGFEP
jgi:hypothetical protein